MSNNPNAIPSPSAPTWQNWTGNLVHKPASDGVNYYFAPTSLSDLKSALAQVAKIPGAIIRVSGQRHSQPPLVADDNRNAVPAKTTEFLVDMSCYRDLPGQNQGIVLGPGKNQVTVNAGVREDALDAFLTQNNLMMKTVTAGGFFSIGGMTAVDVHGGTVNAPIFAETASAFNILLADGTVKTFDATLPPVNGWSPLQFARVSLGGLGIITSITLDVLPRPSATTLDGGMIRYLLKDKAAFIAQFQQLLTGPLKHDRMEVFYSPYAAAPNLPFPVDLENFLVLWWNENSNSGPKNSATQPETACELLQEGRFGAPLLGGLAKYAAKYVRESQYFSNPYSPLHIPPVPPSGFAAIALNEIETQAADANKINSDLWLTASSQVMFMSYYFEMPNLDAVGLGKVWDGLAVVADRVIQDDNFHIAAPMEFRFVKAGNSAMSGSYSTNPNAWFINLDLIGFIEPTPAADYPQLLLQFFADVERDWVAMGGITHNGKMYGFYDPKTHSATGPFNPNFLADLRARRDDARRGAPLTAYSAYRKSMDPKGLFYNNFLRQLLEP